MPSTQSTSKLLIVIRNVTRSCIQHSIVKLLSLSFVSCMYCYMSSTCSFEPSTPHMKVNISIIFSQWVPRHIARHFLLHILDIVFCKWIISFVIVYLFVYLSFLFITYNALFLDPYYIACLVAWNACLFTHYIRFITLLDWWKFRYYFIKFQYL